MRTVALQYDGTRKRFPVEVVADIYPMRLGPVRATLIRDAGGGDAVVLQRLVASGLRGQLRTGNLLTGQLYVALDFVPGAPQAATVVADGTIRLPTVPGTLSELQPQIAEIVHKISKIPFDDIGRDLSSTLSGASTAITRLTPEAQRALAEVQKTLAEAQKTLSSADKTFAGAQSTLDNLDRNIVDSNAPLQRGLNDTLQELQRTARALRVLSDYLQQHPESLLRGKPADPPVPPR